MIAFSKTGYFMVLVLVLIVTAGRAFAQQVRGTITGRVTDPQGAAMPGVKILATQVENGAKYETQSGADGVYALTYLAPGTYRLSAEASGFQRYERTGIILGANESLGVDIPLQIGLTTQTITVNAASPVLETTTASTGEVIGPVEMANLPINGNTPAMLAQLAPGVLFLGTEGLVAPYNHTTAAQISMSGGITNMGYRDELLIDGSPNTAQGNSNYYNPPIESVTEVKVDTFQPDAAYADTGGGVVNVILKSGTNQFHGAAYEFNQVSALAAPGFFANRAGTRKPVSRFNQFGVSVGGPVYIPKLFDGRNKLLFQFSYEGIKNDSISYVTDTVPTAAERTGDFSALLALGSSYQIYDPATGVLTSAGTRVSRQTFAGNIIPSNRISSIATNILTYYPQPTQAGLADGSNNWFKGVMTPLNFGNELGRLDFLLGEKQKMSFSFRHSLYTTSSNAFGNIVTQSLNENPNWGAILDDVYTFSPTIVLDARASWTRYTQRTLIGSEGFNPTQLGLPNYIAANSPALQFPVVAISGYTGIGNTQVNSPFDVYEIFSTLTKIDGKHMLKFGMDLRREQTSFIQPNYSTGDYSFGTNWTVGPLDNSPAAPRGQGLASFLLGMPTTGEYDLEAQEQYGANHWAVFIQDDWRVRPSLTINLGLRHEQDMGTIEKHNRTQIGWDYTDSSPIQPAALAAYEKNPDTAISPVTNMPRGAFDVLGGMLFATPQQRKLSQPPDDYLSPRLGFAWKPPFGGGKTVVRSGFGVFYQAIPTEGIFQSGFTQISSLVSTQNGYLSPYGTLSNPFPAGIQQPTGSSLGLGTFMGNSSSIHIYGDNPRAVLNLYMMRWNFNIQRELPRNFLFEIGYVGNRGVHLVNNGTIDPDPPQAYSPLMTRDQNDINYMTAIIANPFAGLLPGTSLNGATISRSQLMMRFPQFISVSAQDHNNGSSYFEALTLRLDKRFSNGLELLSNYQYSRLMSNVYRKNSYDLTPSENQPDYTSDRPNRVVVSAIYALPVGRGKRFAGGASAWVSQIIGGWKLANVYTFQSGPPDGYGDVIYYGGNLNWNSRNINEAFDITKFDRNAADQLAWNKIYDNSSFSNLRDDGINNFDTSLSKSFPIKEKVKLEYRCQFFNLLNHPMFAGPDWTPTDSAFGKITSVVNTARVVQMALRLEW